MMGWMMKTTKRKAVMMLLMMLLLETLLKVSCLLLSLSKVCFRAQHRFLDRRRRFPFLLHHDHPALADEPRSAA
jgi:hypothetical protein